MKEQAQKARKPATPRARRTEIAGKQTAPRSVGSQAERRKEEIQKNYEVFRKQVADLLPEHKNQYCLLRKQKVVGFFDNAGDAYDFGLKRFRDDVFSIQEVTNMPVDLGYFSHAVYRG